VVGAGVVGCAIARRFALEGARVAILEKSSDILEGASKGNSAILHTGFDAPEDSLELRCIREGYQEYLKIRGDLGLPLEETGGLIVAWNEEEEKRLGDLLRRAHANGIAQARIVDGAELRKRESNLSARARAGIEIPGENVIDPWSAPLAYLSQALANGARLYLNTEVTGGRYDGSQWALSTNHAEIACRQVINCAGLYGDLLDRAVLGETSFEIKPRKGQFLVFDKAARTLISSIILPVPTQRTKGILICPTIFGNLLVGPTAEDQESRGDASVTREVLQQLLKFAKCKLPALADIPVTATYAGIRPASEIKDYRIQARLDQGWITVGGIRSTGLTAALGIAKHVYWLYSQAGHRHQPLASPILPRIPVLAEGDARDWRRQGHGDIVCHCELVTEREVRDALKGPLAAQNLGGLKRRTRVTMGRCQGFYCLARLAEMTEGKFAQPLAVGAAHD